MNIYTLISTVVYIKARTPSRPCDLNALLLSCAIRFVFAIRVALAIHLAFIIHLAFAIRLVFAIHVPFAMNLASAITLASQGLQTDLGRLVLPSDVRWSKLAASLRSRAFGNADSMHVRFLDKQGRIGHYGHHALGLVVQPGSTF